MTYSTEIIIPTYNGADHIGALLTSLTEQNTDNFSVTVSDNRSTDATVSLTETFRDQLDIRVVDSSEKKGKAYALNNAVAQSHHSNILFIDQDDTVEANYVAAMSDALASNSFVAASMDAIKLNALYEMPPRIAPRDQKFGQFAINIAAGGTLGIRREAIEKIGLFDEEFNYSTNDVEFCYRAYQKQYYLQLVEDAVVNYRFRSSLIGNYRQGLSYGLGNYAIAQRYPEIRGDQQSVPALMLNAEHLLGRFLKNRTERARNIHEFGKTIGQLSARLHAGFQEF